MYVIRSIKMRIAIYFQSLLRTIEGQLRSIKDILNFY